MSTPDAGLVVKRKKSAMFAFVLFLLLNVGLFKVIDIHFDQFKYPYTSWVWWVIKDIRQSQRHYNLAATGSSLMINAFTNYDANYLQKDVDVSRHHSADYFDKSLSTVFGGNYQTINLATPGQMPSDAYLILKTVLKLGQHPDVLIYGVAPRDFLDGTLNAASDTEPYLYLSRIINTEDLNDKLFSSSIDRIQHWLEQSLFCYRYSIDLKLALNDYVTKALNIYMPPPTVRHPFTYKDRLRLLPNYKGPDIAAGVYEVAPFRGNPSGQWTVDNTADYMQRYSRPNQQTFQTQLFFLGRLSQLCEDNDIRLILINMPLSTRNMALLAHHRYLVYLAKVKDFVRQANVPFYDFNGLKLFGDDLFNDSAHLNAFGGKLFMDTLVVRVYNDPIIRDKIRAIGDRRRPDASLAQAGHTNLQ